MKTNKEKNLHGTAREDRTKKTGVSNATKIPTPEKYLTNRGRKIYRNICKHLLENDALCNIDSLYISQAAAAFDRYYQAEEDIITYGITQTFEKSGAVQVSPWYTIMTNERKQCEVFARRLGLNISSREKLVAMQADTVEYDDFFASLTKARAYEN
jgi:P27 family predicted phage terminase small subunit